MEDFIDDSKINELIDSNTSVSEAEVDKILNKALELKGLELADVAKLINIADDKILDKLFKVAYKIKDAIYGNRLVMFAPLYVSNHCSNNCLYCEPVHKRA